MKANELRIGNYHIWDGVECEVEASTLSSMHYGNIESDPVPLTEEWYNKIYLNNTDIVCFSDYGGKYCIVIDAGDLEEAWIEVKTVHQTQNLYFALTNQELSISD